MFEKVTRQKAKLRLALTGVSGAGKTLLALYIAYGITGDWGKIALIDTEHERARFYAKREDLKTGEFLYAPMAAPFSPEKYRAMVEEGAREVGEDGVVIVDSFSHAWNSEGGVLDLKDKIRGAVESQQLHSVGGSWEGPKFAGERDFIGELPHDCDNALEDGLYSKRE